MHLVIRCHSLEEYRLKQPEFMYYTFVNFIFEPTVRKRFGALGKSFSSFVNCFSLFGQELVQSKQLSCQMPEVQQAHVKMYDSQLVSIVLSDQPAEPLKLREPV